MAKHHLNNLAHKELKMQHLENCSRSIAKPHVVHVSSCRWILPSMSECCLWWFERNSILWKINTSFYQSDHITLLNSNFAHILKELHLAWQISFGVQMFVISDVRFQSCWQFRMASQSHIYQANICSNSVISNIIKHYQENGLLPLQHQAIIWTEAKLSLPIETGFS